MATFPTIQARVRAYSLPSRTSSGLQLLTGVRVDWLRGEISSNAPIAITFLALTRAVALTISSHYRGEKQHRGFAIPTSLWQSHDDLYDLTPIANQAYRYAAPPSLTERDGLFDVTIQLVTFF
jgi:hypothetical protein